MKALRSCRMERDAAASSKGDGLLHSFTAPIERLVTSHSCGFRNRSKFSNHSAGHSGQPWQESFVAMGFLTVAIAIIAASILVLWGLRERLPRSTIVGNIRNSTFSERRKDADHEPVSGSARWKFLNVLDWYALLCPFCIHESRTLSLCSMGFIWSN